MLEIIPAIDLKDGKCVRLVQGKDNATTEYSNDPVAVAKDWISQGAKRLHIVNLDGAFGRASGNFEIVKTISREVDALIEFGGGLRTMDDVERAVEAGVRKVVLGTSAVDNPEFVHDVLRRFGADRLMVALDAERGMIVTRGWRHVSDVSVIELANQMKAIGVTEVLYTDTSRDGMLSGPDYATLQTLAATGLNVIASGGVSSHDDVVRLMEMQLPNIIGVIIGKALYERRIILSELIAELTRRSELR